MFIVLNDFAFISYVYIHFIMYEKLNSIVYGKQVEFNEWNEQIWERSTDPKKCNKKM